MPANAPHPYTTGAPAAPPATHGIRPMTLKPDSPQVAALSNTVTTGSGTGAGFAAMVAPDEFSSPGDPPPFDPPDPVIWYSNAVQIPPAPNNVMSEKIAIGRIISFTVKLPDNCGYSLVSEHWEGGSDISGYLDTDELDVYKPAPQTQKGPEHNVLDDQPTYTFVVPALEPGQSKQYDVKVSVVERNDQTEVTGDGPPADVKFTAYAPAQADLQVLGRHGPNAWMDVAADEDGKKWQHVQFISDSPPNPQSPGIAMTATTSGGELAGKGAFMMLQTAMPKRYEQDFPMQTGPKYKYYLSTLNGNPVGDGPYQDGENSLAYPSIPDVDGVPQTNTQGNLRYFWYAYANDNNGNPVVTTRYLEDSPAVVTPISFWMSSAGDPDTQTPEKYTTYLMFRPLDPGVWVALKKVEWQWGDTTRNRGSAETPNWLYDDDLYDVYNPQPDPVATSAVGKWPTWKARIVDIEANNPDVGGGPGWVKIN